MHPSDSSNLWYCKELESGFRPILGKVIDGLCANMFGLMT